MINFNADIVIKTISDDHIDEIDESLPPPLGEAHHHKHQ